MKKTSILIRVICALFALAMCAGCFVSCKDKTPDPTDETTVREEGTKEPAETEKEAVLDLPNDLIYDNEEITILVRHNEKEYYALEDFGKNEIQAAAYERNCAVEERLGVVFEFKDYNGFVKGATETQTAIRTSVASDKTFDIVMPNSFVGTVLITEGLYVNLADMEYLDLTQPYWWHTWTENNNINGKVFSITGDACSSTLETPQVVFYNKSYVGDYSLESPYDMMDDNRWTLDNMFAMAQSVTEDLNQDGNYDENDRYGMITNTLTISGVPTSMGIPIVSRNNDTDYEFTFVQEKTNNLVTKFRTALDNKYLHFYNSTSEQETMKALFGAERALFMWYYAGAAPDLKDTDINYGILPPPKFDADQDGYLTACTGQAACFIPVNLGDERTERAAAVLQAMGYYSYTEFTPEYFDSYLCIRSTKDEESMEVLMSLHDITYFSLTDVFTSNFKVVHMFKNCFMSDQMPQGWWQENSAENETALDALMTYYENLK